VTGRKQEQPPELLEQKETTRSSGNAAYLKDSAPGQRIAGMNCVPLFAFVSLFLFSSCATYVTPGRQAD
jgi:hypothetical protein